MRQLILASSSPRRKKLLTEAGYQFKVVPAVLSEPELARQNLSPTQVAEALANFKTQQVAKSHPQAVVLGADTVVALGDQIFGKAADENHARQILSTLAGSRHHVITGIAIICVDTSSRLIASDSTGIWMRPISDETVDQYIRSGAWKGKAGAYAIQEGGDTYIERIDGSFSNVVGLPMELTSRMLAQFGIFPADGRCPSRR